MNQTANAVVECRLCNNITEFYFEQWQLEELAKPRRERMLIQDIFPNFSIGDRELIISNTCDTCWQKLYSNEEEEI
jgi:hypothetical protein